MKVGHYKIIIAFPQMAIASFLYLLHRFCFCSFEFYAKSVFRFYFGDLLALIVCVPIFVNSQVFFRIRKPVRIKTWEIVLYSIIFSVYFEIVGPIFLKNFTADFFDCVAYFLGGLILYLSQFWRKKI
ncbi:MAG: hypothetical protein NC489_40795 [Ruminococcus flavefaciens]|nr:hypothetical protein [Ruminococcus flavefaciens]